MHPLPARCGHALTATVTVAALSASWHSWSTVPRCSPRVDAPAIGVAFACPLLWLVATLAVGWVTRWVPNPFLDARAEGWGTVGAASAGITALFVVLFALFRYGDGRRTA